MKDLFGNVDEEGMYQLALSAPLEIKENQAISLIKSLENTAMSVSGRGFDVANSGGKDSVVIMDLVRKSGVKHFSHYGNTTIDPPELVRFIKQNFPETEWINVGKHLILSTKEHASGLPTRRGKWCCDIYKHNHGVGVQIVGIRAEESARRKGLWKQINTIKKEIIIAPILYWTEGDVWNYIKNNNLAYCSLYDETDESGQRLFKRLGCVACPNADREKEFKRWPAYKTLWRKGGREWWEKFHDLQKPDGTYYFAHKFKTFEDYWSWWMEEKNVNDTDQPDCQMWLW